MRRRDVLATIGLASLAGCIGSGGGGSNTTTDSTTDEPTTTDDPTTSEPTTTTDGGADWSADLEVLAVECGSPEDESATISFTDEGPSVSGTIIGSDMCYIARLDRLVYDEMTRELVVVVESVSDADADTACAECIAAVDYRFTATFTGEGPTSVEVVHKARGREQTVASASK